MKNLFVKEKHEEHIPIPTKKNNKKQQKQKHIKPLMGICSKGNSVRVMWK